MLNLIRRGKYLGRHALTPIIYKHTLIPQISFNYSTIRDINYNADSEQLKHTISWKIALLLGCTAYLGYNFLRQNNLGTIRAEEGLKEEDKSAQNELNEELKEDLGKPLFPEHILKSIQNAPKAQDFIVEITNENVTEIGENRIPQLIFLEEEEFPEELLAIITPRLNEFSTLTKIPIYKITKSKKELLDQFLKLKNPEVETEKFINQYAFLLINSSNDLWFWEIELLMHLKGDILTQIINYFKDIPLLDSHRNLAIKNTMNTLHFVSYLGDPNDLSQLKKLKIMRKLQTKNTDQFLNCQFWMVTDPKIADRLKISTQEKGNLYLIKEVNNGRVKAEHITICGNKFESSLFATAEEAMNSPFQVNLKMLLNSLSSPLIIRNAHEFIMLRGKYNENTLIVYADERKHDITAISQMLEKVRAEHPFISPTNEQIENKENINNLLLAITTTQNLYPFFNPPSENSSSEPIIRFLETDSNPLDLTKSHLQPLKRIESLPKEEYFQLIDDPSNESKYKINSTDSDKEINQKKTKRTLYSTERFKFDRIYQFEGEQKAEGVSKFVRRCLAGKEDIYFENKNVKEKYSWKIVGQDFEKVVLESDRDCLVLITNSVRGKNEGFDVMYEEFVKENCTKYNKSDILLGRLNAINESFAFKFPKSPAMLYFKRGQKNNPIVFDLKEHRIAKRMKERSSFKSSIMEFIDNNKTF